MGMTAVLHTWGSTLTRHVHLHCLVPGGGITPEGNWRNTKSDYLFPVRALSRYFRGRLVSQLRVCANTGKLHRITREGEIDDILDRLMAQDWVVYNKPCLEAGDRVIDYLARYTTHMDVGSAENAGAVFCPIARPSVMPVSSVLSRARWYTGTRITKTTTAGK